MCIFFLLYRSHPTKVLSTWCTFFQRIFLFNVICIEFLRWLFSSISLSTIIYVLFVSCLLILGLVCFLQLFSTSSLFSEKKKSFKCLKIKKESRKIGNTNRQFTQVVKPHDLDICVEILNFLETRETICHFISIRLSNISCGIPCVNQIWGRRARVYIQYSYF